MIFILSLFCDFSNMCIIFTLKMEVRIILTYYLTLKVSIYLLFQHYILGDPWKTIPTV